MKAKDSTETVCVVLTMIKRKNQPTKTWVDKGTDNAGEVEKFWKAEGLQIHTAEGETEPQFAEPTVRFLKNILHRYKKEYG